jgi:hypothetical protein
MWVRDGWDGYITHNPPTPTHWTTPVRNSSCNYRFDALDDIFVNRCDRIYVVDRLRNRVIEFSNNSALDVTITCVARVDSSDLRYLKLPEMLHSMNMEIFIYSRIQRISTKDNELRKIISVSVKRGTNAKQFNFSSSITVGCRWNLNFKK